MEREIITWTKKPGEDLAVVLTLIGMPCPVIAEPRRAVRFLTKATLEKLSFTQAVLRNVANVFFAKQGFGFNEKTVDIFCLNVLDKNRDINFALCSCSA